MCSVYCRLSDKASPLTASMLTYVRGFEIPPRKESHLIDNKCCITGFQEITTMAFRVHTHVMGRSELTYNALFSNCGQLSIKIELAEKEYKLQSWGRQHVLFLYIFYKHKVVLPPSSMSTLR